MTTNEVRIVEVGPRDGLQNETRQIPTDKKVELIRLLVDAGLAHVEATSFVSPKWVPQLSDASELMSAVPKLAGVTYAALTPNLRGYETALAAGCDEVAIFAAASETFSQKNINCSISESFERFVPLLERARHDDVPVRGYVSCIAGCPYEGDVDRARVAYVASRLAGMGCYQVSLGDTTGSGTPDQIALVLSEVMSIVPSDKLAGHYHDTYGHALKNIEASLKLGLRCFDTAIGGLGGCPYAPGAKGNVSTLSVAKFLNSIGIKTGIGLSKLQEADAFAKALVGRP